MAPPQNQKNSRTGFYSVLGLASDASPCAIRNAYRKLAMKWHPDKRCNEDSRDAKLKFQEIQEAYTGDAYGLFVSITKETGLMSSDVVFHNSLTSKSSEVIIKHFAWVDARSDFLNSLTRHYIVLSDTRKKVLYDHGLYDPNDNEEDIEGLSCFMHELSGMMTQVESKEKEGKAKANSLEDLQQIFLDIFGTSSQIAAGSNTNIIYPSVTTQINNKRSRNGQGPSVLLSESMSYIRTSKTSPMNGHVFFNDCFDSNSKAGKKTKR